MTLKKLVWLKLRTSLLVGLALLLVGSGLVFYRLARPSASTQPLRNVTFNYRITPAPGRQAEAAPMPVTIKLMGTPGLPYELVYTPSDGPAQTVVRILPDVVSFTSDGFDVIIDVKGSGKFGYEISRGSSVRTAKSTTIVTNGYSVGITVRLGGQDIHVSHH
jgi:hypothetical protein